MINIEQIASLAVDMILDTGQLHPFLYINRKQPAEDSGTIMIMPQIAMDQQELKDMMLQMVGAYISQELKIDDAAEIYFAAEAWASKDPKGGLMPSEDPDRIEVILISCINVETKKVQAIVYEIVRNGDNIDLGPFGEHTDAAFDMVESRMMELILSGYEHGIQSQRD